MPLQPPHPGALSPLMMYNSEHLTSPPPAHMGIPPVHIDPKTGEYSFILTINIMSNFGQVMIATASYVTTLNKLHFIQ